jgi:hypothetical protein
MIARDIRFQVCMATPLAHLWAYVDAEHQPVVEQPLLAGFAAEIEEILAIIPAAELAIQWDMPHDILSIEGNRKLHVDVSHAGLRKRWSELAEKIPPAAEVGFHFCYGDSGGKHSIEPRDTRVMVDFANDLTAAIGRPISYFHFPVPIERSDEGFFAPLKGLNLAPGTELFLGLVIPRMEWTARGAESLQPRPPCPISGSGPNAASVGAIPQPSSRCCSSMQRLPR